MRRLTSFLGGISLLLLPLGGGYFDDGFATLLTPPNPPFPPATAQDSLLFVEKQKIATAQTGLPQQALAIAQSFLGAPYTHGTLDKNAEEQLVVNLRQLDCWTFVENSVAIAQAGTGDFEAYQQELQKLRYWGGTINGFGSRLHYFTGWIMQAEKYHYLRDITAELGGVRYQKKFHYISARPTKYPKVSDKAVLRAIQAAEDRLNAHPWHFIPKSKVAAIESRIQEGDIILLCSAKADLDIAHEGFAVKKNGRIYLLHASSLQGRVMLSREPLPEYMAKQRGQSGIMVVRLGRE